MFLYLRSRTMRASYPESRTARRTLLAAACIAAASVLILLASSPLLHAQCGPVPHDFCEDTCCQTDALLLNTGYDHAAGGVYPIGSQDAYWTIVADGQPTRLVPRPADVIAAAGFWLPAQANTQWINGNGGAVDPFKVRVTYEKCFCTCGPDSTDLTFSMSILSDNRATILVDNVIVGAVPPPGFNVLTVLKFTMRVAPGRHCIDVEVTNGDGGSSGLNIQGTVQGAGLLKYNCCAAAPEPIHECDTSRVTFGTDNTWTLVSEPVGCAGVTPRCADIITTIWWPSPWGSPIAGTNWIGGVATGLSCPGVACPVDYVYRKSFCVAQAGTFIITVTAMSDDFGVVELNGVTLTPAGIGFNYATPTTQTFIVALDVGCNCLDIRVSDLGCAITGLDALVDIQGGHLLKPQCCQCPGCNVPPAPMRGPREGDNDAQMGIHSRNDAAAEARPMLVSVPNPATGETTVHYMLDTDADAHVELYNSAGQRVLVVDEGVRAKGAHAVPLVTTGLAKGAYHLRLVYGTHTLTVPLTVQ